MGSNFHWHVPSDFSTLYMIGLKISQLKSRDSFVTASAGDKNFYFSQLGDVNTLPLPENDVISSNVPKEALIMNFGFQLEDKGFVY